MKVGCKRLGYFVALTILLLFVSCISPKKEADYTATEPIPTEHKNEIQLIITEERFSEPPVPTIVVEGVPQIIKNWSSVEMLEYKIGPGDVVRVTILVALEANSYEVAVATDGTIVLPLIGPFPIGNKTVEQARDEMREAFNQYYVNPQVQLRVMQFSSQKVYLMGAVKGKGLYPITKRTTLFEVMTYMEDLLPDVDLNSAYLMRDGKMYPLHLERLLSGDLSTNYELLNNDILYLPSRKTMKVYALGEVLRPGMYDMERNDNVFYLLARAGGLTKGAAAKEVRIIRGGMEDPTLITINIRPLVKKHPPSQLNQGTGSLTELAVSVDATRKNTVSLEKLYLKDGDIVFVPPTGLEQWNQIIAKITPTLSFVTAPFLILQDIVYLRTFL